MDRRRCDFFTTNHIPVMTNHIFDLRDNSGGYLDQALLLCNAFLEAGDTIVYLQGLHRKREDYVADGRGQLKGNCSSSRCITTKRAKGTVRS